MEKRIEPIGRIERIAGVEKIRGYTPAERIAKIKEIEKLLADKAEIQAYLAKFPNPEHLSFSELLERAINENKMRKEELDYILDIGNHQNEKDGYILEIGEKSNNNSI
ncbi:hypothetical protein [Treponema sp.]|uniref:hypothetical protein n=1 Tax=Treponema sp. TaxID=166 RepID=UPI00388E6CE8